VPFVVALAVPQLTLLQMVLDAGKLVEFDSPVELLGRDSSLFRALVEESADKEQLYGLVQGKERL
jgi:hypothetical protein